MEMCEFAPNIISMYDNLGVTFNRHADGSPDTRYFGGTKYRRTHYADTTTGYQILSALDGQARRYEEQGLIKRISGRDFVSALIDNNGNCQGCIVQDIYSHKLEAYTGVAVIIATGGYAGLYGWATTALLSNGAAAGQLLMQGASIANPEFVQFHPTSIAFGDKPRLISESARGEGGRLWVPVNGKPWYFMEEMSPDLGNLAARDVASRTIYKVVTEMGLGVEGKHQVYLDITHLSEEVRNKKLSNIIELYYKFTGDDPRKVPMRVFPSPHYSMGGIYVDSKHRTEIKNIYACGECDYLYHGSNRLGGNSLLSATYSGYIAATTIFEDYNGGKLPQKQCSNETKWIVDEVSKWENEIRGYTDNRGNERIETISKELGDVLTQSAGVLRYNEQLKKALEKINELKQRWCKIETNDKNQWANSSIISIRKLRSCIILSEAIARGALARNESRGAHYKPDFPDSDNSNWLKTTIAKYDRNEIKLDYKPVDVSLLKPQ
jgi:succinate dehydrogenase / fumarate reductase flavoprotein subunit